jgi:FPC/CPF motif-containing protein YcgG
VTKQEAAHLLGLDPLAERGAKVIVAIAVVDKTRQLHGDLEHTGTRAHRQTDTQIRKRRTFSDEQSVANSKGSRGLQ